MAKKRFGRRGMLLAVVGVLLGATWGLFGGVRPHALADSNGNWTIVHKHWSMIERSEALHHGRGSLPVDEPDATGQY